MSNPTELPEGWKFIAVNSGFDDLMYSLERQSGNCGLSSDLDAAWESFGFEKVVQPEGEAPQAVAQVYIDMDSWMDVAISDLPTWERKGYTTRTLYPAATLSPLCGAQHAESGKDGVAIAAFKKWHQEVGDQDCEYTWLQAWTASQFSPDLKKRMADALNVTLWLYRRLPGAYGRPPFVDASLMEMAKIADIDAQGAIAERAAQLDGGQEGSD